MGTVDLPKKNAAPRMSEKPETDGIHDAQLNMNEEQLTRIFEEEAGKLVYRLGAVLKDGLNEKLYDSINSNFRDVIKRFWVYLGAENIRDVFNEEGAGFSICYSPEEIAGLLNSSGGIGKFNAGEIEKTAVNAAAADDLETYANNILRHKDGAAAFLHGDNACTVVGCAFSDNAVRPKTVTDIRLAVNILESSLVSPGFYDLALVRHLVKNIVSSHVINGLTGEPDFSAEQASHEALFERITALCSEIDPAAVNIRENAGKIAGMEHIRNLGFGMAVNSLLAILDSAKLPYQFIEYLKNGRELLIREYEDTDAANLPDERYQLRLQYFDGARLADERAAYSDRFKALGNDVQYLWDLLEVLYQDSKSIFKVNDFEDLVRKNKNRLAGKTRDELSQVSLAGTEKEKLRVKIARINERIKNMRDALNPNERQVIEDRLAWLEKEYACFDEIINPHHLRSGLLFDIKVTSIKRKKTTLDSMAAALNEFLRRVTGDFQNAAAITFSAATQP